MVEHTPLDRSVSDLPFVSVVMPVRNEADLIERSLGSVLAQCYPRALLEVVIADGESTDDTVDRIRKMSAATDIPIRIVRNPNKIAPSALNAAIAQARGKIFVRVDGHCEIEPDYVANCVEHLTKGKADGVGGPIETIGIGLQAQAIAVAMSSKFGVGGSAFRTVTDREMYTDTVAFPGYTREIVERTGPFNEELVRNQDDEYNFRIRKSGGRILLSPDIRSKYYSRSTFRSLWNQYFQYGYWKVRVFQLHPRQMSLRQFIPSLFVLTIVGASLLALYTTAGAWSLLGLTLLYIVASFAASVSRSRSQPALIPLLMLSFTILHVSYGLGFLAGLASFAGNWFRPRTTARIRPAS